MAMGNSTTPYENAPAIEQAMQWALDDLLTRHRQPSQDDLTLVPQGEATEIIQSLIKSLDKGGEIGVRRAFTALCKDDKYKWLKDIKNKPVPAREGEERPGGPSEDQDERITTSKSGKKVFRTLSMSEIKRLPRAQWHVPGIYQKVSVSLTYGDANTGKTFVDLDMSLCMAYGMHWQGRKLEKTLVLYIYGEGNEGLANRVEAWQKHHDKPDTDTIRFICFPVQLMSELEVLCATIEDMDEIPAFIVIDTFSVCSEGIPENDNVEVAKFIACAAHIKRTYKTHVHIIHHAGKNGDYRGAAAFRGNVDTMTLLSRAGQDEPIVMSCKKQKDAEYFKDIRLNLEQVEIGFDEDTFTPITSCVVVACMPTVTNSVPLAGKTQKCLDLLADGMTLAEWQKLARNEMSISDRTVERYRDLLETKGLIKRKESDGKHATYWHIWGSEDSQDA